MNFSGVSDNIGIGVSDNIGIGVSDNLGIGVSDNIGIGVSDDIGIGVSDFTPILSICFYSCFIKMTSSRMLSLCFVIQRSMRVIPLDFCLRVIVNEKSLNLEKTTSSVLSVLLLIYGWKNM